MKDKKIKHCVLTIDNDYIESEIYKNVDESDKLEVLEYEETKALIKKSAANGNLEYAMHKVDEALMDIIGEVGERFVEELVLELEKLEREER
tara:strand:- start:11 stop:286 length:276 start_codon:yes stop_codon:yes gene_type:complete